jgi:hypothetical protein
MKDDLVKLSVTSDLSMEGFGKRVVLRNISKRCSISEKMIG